MPEKRADASQRPPGESTAFVATYVVRTVTMVVLPVFLLFREK